MTNQNNLSVMFLCFHIPLTLTHNRAAHGGRQKSNIRQQEELGEHMKQQEKTGVHTQKLTFNKRFDEQERFFVFHIINLELFSTYDSYRKGYESTLNSRTFIFTTGVINTTGNTLFEYNIVGSNIRSTRLKPNY